MKHLTVKKEQSKEKRKKRMIGYSIVAVLLLCILVTVQFRIDRIEAYARLASLDVKTIDTEFGTMGYLEEGQGEALLLSHGIMGGYDQGMLSLTQLVGDHYRKIAPARFGYLESELPQEPTPYNQARAYVSLMDQLQIEKIYVVATSAGGPSAIQMAIHYPDRIKGLILVSAGGPGNKVVVKDGAITGPPSFFVNDFPMWFTGKYMKFIYHAMFGSEVSKDFYQTMLPLDPRKAGVQADTDFTNTDIRDHFEDYPVEEIKVPILVIQSKDDPMISYEDVEAFIKRSHAESVIFETGGHLITGNGNKVNEAILHFIDETENKK